MKTPPAPANPGATILLVDDNPHGMVARRTVLEELGYTVHAGTNGQEALSVLQHQAVDLVITDFRMPNMDGVELITHIRQLRADLPIILLSGFVEPLGLTEESTGADVVLSKSAGEMGFLVRSVRRLLSRQPARKPLESEHIAKSKKARNAG
ncbi:MAG TPA: response regulator [Bryobacteraceae bacterium]|nr:response regulator [Bryobacteraceae bacterium]